MDTKMRLLLCGMAFLCLFDGLSAFPSGAPDSACDDMIPQHLGDPITLGQPYSLQVSSTYYEAGRTITVTLRGNSGEQFRGFSVQARDSENREVRVGTFEVSSNNQQTNCQGRGVTHTSRSDKSSVTLTWRAPDSLAGNVVFRATVVRVYSVHYGEIFSDVVSNTPPPTTTTTTTTTTPSPPTTTTTTTSSPPTTTTTTPSTTTTTTPSPPTTTTTTPSPLTTTTATRSPPPTTTTTTTTRQTETPQPTTTTTSAADMTIDLSTCGTEKGCFRYPEDCDIDTCTTVATWTPAEGDETSVMFEMQGRNVGWVGLGFSDDDMMGEDYVLMCARSSGSATITSTYNVVEALHQNLPFDDENYGIGPSAARYEDGVLRCIFRREISTSTIPGSRRRRREDADQFYDIRDPFTLFLGHGPVFGGRPSLHSEIPQISTEKVHVARDVTDIGISDTQPTYSPPTRVVSFFLSILYGLLDFFGFRF